MVHAKRKKYITIFPQKMVIIIAEKFEVYYIGVFTYWILSFQRNVMASGVIPQISLIMGPCAGEKRKGSKG